MCLNKIFLYYFSTLFFYSAGLSLCTLSSLRSFIRYSFIRSEGELNENVVVRKFRTTTQHGAMEGKTQTNEVMFYNLEMITSIGFRVKSKRGNLCKKCNSSNRRWGETCSF
jgi:hypothetical protein